MDQHLSPAGEAPSKQPDRPATNPPAIRFFRVLIWLSPGPAIGALGIMLEWGSYNIHSSFELLAIPLAIVLCLAIGFFDGCLSPSNHKTDGKPNMSQAFCHGILFTFAQVLLVPFVWILALLLILLVLKVLSLI